MLAPFGHPPAAPISMSWNASRCSIELLPSRAPRSSSKPTTTSRGGAVRHFLPQCPESGAAKLVRLTETEGADGHCAGLGQRVWEEMVYGWLGDVLAL
jgi:hypothetical protein